MKLEKYFQKHNYKILEEIGQGGTGQVYRARHLKTETVRAIKIISQELTKSKEFQGRFRREMEILQTLSHPNIVQAFEFGMDDEENVYYVVLEYVDGESLQELLHREKQLPLAQALGILGQMAKALQYAFEMGLVHRDVKPGNIMLDQEGSAKLTDFGLVKADDYEQNSVTSSGSILGTPYYLAPEQAFSSKRVDIRADIYSLGITFFHMLAGTPPFVYENYLRVITAHCYNPLPSIEDYRKGVPQEVLDLLDKMTFKDREKRFSTPGEILEIVEDLEIRLAGLVDAQESRSEGKGFLEKARTLAPSDAQTHAPEMSTTLHTRSFKRRLLKLGKQLIGLKLITSDQLADLMEKEDFLSVHSLPELLTKHNLATEEEIAKALAKEYKLPLVFPDQIPISQDLLGKVPQEIAEKTTSIPIQLEETTLLVAVEDPIFTTAKEEIQFLTGHKVRLAVATRTSILKAIEQNYNVDRCVEDFLKESGDLDSLRFLGSEDGKKEGPSNLDEMDASSSPVVKLAQHIIIGAIKKKASDIHIEPQAGVMVVRYRIDGVLSEEMRLPIWLSNALVSRIKILAKMDISEKRIPQDGRISFLYKERKIISRVSTLPSYRGEKIVLRLLDPSGSLLPLQALGFEEKTLQLINRSIHKPQGILLTTGPTGSGKSTTLYSILNVIKSPEINIITLEDPVEYELGGLTQVQINPRTGLTFGAALRSVLRQDPDVVLVGEIRDLETAEIAFEASMTGHFVLSTLHTNDTPSTITRLIEMGLDPFLISSSLEIILAQRLVRRICKNCKTPYVPDPQILKDFEEFQDVPSYRGSGCITCDHKGYKGRVGIYEIMPITRRVKDVIQAKGREEEIRQAATLAGMVTLWQSALNKILNGETTIEEVLRVIQCPESDEIPCPSCQRKISPDFVACPFCQNTIKSLCENCQKTLRPEWTLCPFCNTSKYGPSVENPLFLVADDERGIVEILSELLGEIYPQCRVIKAFDGQEALEKALSLEPDLVILDVQMPLSSGIEVCSSLRKKKAFASTPIFILTSSFEDQIKGEAYRAGATDFLSKPVNFLEIASKIKGVMTRKR